MTTAETRAIIILNMVPRQMTDWTGEMFFDVLWSHVKVGGNMIRQSDTTICPSVD